MTFSSKFHKFLLCAPENPESRYPRSDPLATLSNFYRREPGTWFLQNPRNHSLSLARIGRHSRDLSCSGELSLQLKCELLFGDVRGRTHYTTCRLVESTRLRCTVEPIIHTGSRLFSPDPGG
jgi:hypothetical protein